MLRQIQIFFNLVWQQISQLYFVEVFFLIMVSCVFAMILYLVYRHRKHWIGIALGWHNWLIK